MLVLHLSNSPFIAGLVTFIAIVPSMLAYIPAGVLVDRWDPWRIMLFSELMRGISLAAVVTCLLVFNAQLDIYLLISFMVTEEILEIFWMLADRRYMSQLTERDKIASNQASIEVRAHAAVLAGRPIGPFLFTMTPFLPFLADAASFVVSVWTLLLLRKSRVRLKRLLPQLPLKPGRRSLNEIGEGFRWLIKNRRAGPTMLLMSLTTLIAQALIMMILAEAHDKKLSTLALGVVLAASGAGGTIGSAVAGHLPDWVKKFWPQIQLTAWSVALGLLVLSGVRLAWCIAAVMLVLGLTGSIGNIEFGSYLVRNVEGSMLGRVVSIGQVLTIAALGLGPFLGGGAIQKLGLQVAAELFFVLVLLIAMVAIAAPWISGLISKRGTVILPPPMAAETEPALGWPESGKLQAVATRPFGEFSALKSSRLLAIISSQRLACDNSRPIFSSSCARSDPLATGRSIPEGPGRSRMERDKILQGGLPKAGHDLRHGCSRASCYLQEMDANPSRVTRVQGEDNSAVKDKLAMPGEKIIVNGPA